MQMTKVVGKRKDSDGLSYEMHYLMEDVSSRCYGHVETPTRDRELFEVNPYGEPKNRSYFRYEEAWEYLISSALKIEANEEEEFAKAFMGKVTNVAVVDGTIASAVDRICSDAGKEAGGTTGQ